MRVRCIHTPLVRWRLAPSKPFTNGRPTPAWRALYPRPLLIVTRDSTSTLNRRTEEPHAGHGFFVAGSACGDSSSPAPQSPHCTGPTLTVTSPSHAGQKPRAWAACASQASHLRGCGRRLVFGIAVVESDSKNRDEDADSERGPQRRRVRVRGLDRVNSGKRIADTATAAVEPLAERYAAQAVGRRANAPKHNLVARSPESYQCVWSRLPRAWWQGMPA